MLLVLQERNHIPAMRSGQICVRLPGEHKTEGYHRQSIGGRGQIAHKIGASVRILHRQRRIGRQQRFEALSV